MFISSVLVLALLGSRSLLVLLTSISVSMFDCIALLCLLDCIASRRLLALSIIRVPPANQETSSYVRSLATTDMIVARSKRFCVAA